jgi:cyclohexadieny/prephenate dehydrogenase
MAERFHRIALIGIGLIGSSIALAVRRVGLADHIAVQSRRRETLDTAQRLGLGDSYTSDPAQVVKDADLVIACVPVGAFAAVAQAIAPALKLGAIVTDVGSVKQSVISQMQPHLPAERNNRDRRPALPSYSTIAGAF